MTWDEFVQKVNDKFIEQGIDRNIPLASVEWNKDFGFDGPEPEIYIRELAK